MSERDEFEAWFEREYPVDATGTRTKYRNTMVMDLMFSAYQAARAPQAVPALTDEQIMEIAKPILHDGDGGYLADTSPEVVVRFARAILAAAPQPSPEKAAALLLAACRRAVMALAHASERMPQYNADYQAVSDAIAAYVDGAAYPKYQD